MDVRREGGGHRTRFGEAAGAFSRVVEVFLVTCRQRWAPGAYNPRALGVSLGISGHRTDLMQEISEPVRDQAHTERELTYAGSGTDRTGNLTVRIGSTVSNTRPRSSGNRSESQPDVCNVISAN